MLGARLSNLLDWNRSMDRTIDSGGPVTAQWRAGMDAVEPSRDAVMQIHQSSDRMVEKAGESVIERVHEGVSVCVCVCVCE